MATDSGFLANIPELETQDDITSWLDKEVTRINALQIKSPDAVEVFSITLHDANPEKLPPDARTITQFTLAVVLADWACYADPANREGFVYLKDVFTVAPGGFRLWLARLDGEFLPIGYTGFHPIAQDTFNRLQRAPDSITNRKQIRPEPESISGANYYYIYNLGIIKQFHKTTASRLLVKEFSNDIASKNACALAAIVVSPDGQRIIERFGLHQSGFITHDGQKELAYVRDDVSASCD
ncbi:hypothetical protein [Desulfovibrio sp. DV]|uniref:hypothetical protein n=1 Tax=Desulfovibrio sp. DV TaxID=1844708 RepID=UPI00094B8026|nr:hypothetical protein [Desulfovibrio sp. DV]